MFSFFFKFLLPDYNTQFLIPDFLNSFDLRCAESTPHHAIFTSLLCYLHPFNPRVYEQQIIQKRRCFMYTVVIIKLPRQYRDAYRDVFSIIPSPSPRGIGYRALTKKVTDEFCLFFKDMTYVPGQFFPYIFFVTKPCISDHFLRWPPKKLVGTIS